MSWQAQTAVTHHSKLNQINLLRLLMYLADGADAHGVVDPAPNQETLAAFFGCSDRTIRTWIGRICEVGELKQIRVGSGPGNPSSYRICLPMPDKGGSKAEVNPIIVSTFQKLDQMEERLSRAEDTILELRKLLEKTEEERRKKGGNKGGRKVEIKAEERWKPSQRSGADDPSSDPSFDPNTPLTPQGGQVGFALDPDGVEVPFFENEEAQSVEEAAALAEEVAWQETLALIQVFEKATGKVIVQRQRNGEFTNLFWSKWIVPTVNMQKMGNGRAADVIQETVAYMDRNNLGVSNPSSIESFVLSKLRQESAAAGGDQYSGPSTGEYGGLV